MSKPENCFNLLYLVYVYVSFGLCLNSKWSKHWNLSRYLPTQLIINYLLKSPIGDWKQTNKSDPEMVHSNKARKFPFLIKLITKLGQEKRDPGEQAKAEEKVQG